MKTNYNEYNDSQQPAIQLLQQMGWAYISANDALSQRDGLLSNVLLEDILAERLVAINNFEYIVSNPKKRKGGGTKLIETKEL